MSSPTSSSPLIAPGYVRVPVTRTRGADVAGCYVQLDLGAAADYDLTARDLIRVADDLALAASVAVVGSSRRVVEWVERGLAHAWLDGST